MRYTPVKAEVAFPALRNSYKLAPVKNPRTTLVTGAGRGIGKAIAIALGRAGYRVGLGSRTKTAVDAVAAEIRKAGGEAFAVLLDVTNPVILETALGEVRTKFGPIEILVNNAGTAKSAPILKTDLELWNELLTVNLTGTFLCTRAVLPGMLERGWGRIVNIASTAAKAGGAYISAYSASKHGVLGFTRSVALEVADKGVTVNAVCPGYVNTPLTDQNIRNIVAKTGRTEAQAREQILAMNPMNRLIEPEEVAQLALFLCSEEAAAINGQAINLDGGRLSL